MDVKAAVVDHAGGVPHYQDFPDPTVEEGQVMVTVEAVAVENVDRAIVAGTHYTAAQFQAALPAIPCFDGIGRLPDGTQACDFLRPGAGRGSHGQGAAPSRGIRVLRPAVTVMLFMI